MYTTIDINANELSPEIIDSIKMSYRDKNIRIEIFEIDETEYLLSSPKNREILLQRKKDIETGENLIEKSDIFK